MTVLGRETIPVGGSSGVLSHTITFFIETAQTGFRFSIATCRRELIPVERLVLILRHTPALSEHLSQQVLGLSIALQCSQPVPAHGFRQVSSHPQPFGVEDA